jgi:AraC-like DNA-binding protein
MNLEKSWEVISIAFACARRRIVWLILIFRLAPSALDFGFYDQSHFTRIFRQFTAATPGVFRADYTSHKTPVAALS